MSANSRCRAVCAAVWLVARSFGLRVGYLIAHVDRFTANYTWSWHYSSERYLHCPWGSVTIVIASCYALFAVMGAFVLPPNSSYTAHPACSGLS